MVPADSQQISRARCYSGTHHAQLIVFTYGTLTLSGGPSQTTSANHDTTRPGVTAPGKMHPTTPHAQPLSGITHTRFSLFRVRSPLLTESLLFSPPTGTEMFHFPASTSTTTMNSSWGDHPSRWPGFPIRTSSDQRSIGNSPRLNAALHVLHRPSMPRHPPCALTTNTQQPTTNMAGR